MSLPVPSPEQVRWEQACPPALTSDNIWQLDVYRSSLFLMHVARGDARALGVAFPARGVADQLMRAAGWVSASIAEGYSRAARVDRLRFFSCALGSARECVTWYQAGLGTLSAETFEARLVLLTRIRTLLLGFIRQQRTMAREGGVFEG